MMDKKFIITSDKDTAEKFISAGFKMISKSGNVYRFINNPPNNFNFSSISDTKKYCFTNILSM